MNIYYCFFIANKMSIHSINMLFVSNDFIIINQICQTTSVRISRL